MKVLYASANIYHHMIPLAKSISRNIGIQNFKYAVLKPIELFRLNLGYDIKSEEQEWVIKAYKDHSNYNEFLQWFDEADIVLFSDQLLFKLAYDRIKKNKLTFYFSERWFKPPIGKLRLIHPKYLYRAIYLNILSHNKNFHYLSQGGYAGTDIKFISNFKNRIWEWGYFTEISKHSDIKTNNKTTEILWCGRMLAWKKVDSLIKAVSLLDSEIINYHLTLIGDGVEKGKLKQLALKLLPDNRYTFLPPQSTSTIREIMRNCDIFVLPSDGYEGWGAVINEAMTEGCAIIASIESGGGKSIINNMNNGIIYNCGNILQLNNYISLLANNQELLNSFKLKGKDSIDNLWSPDVAAMRFIDVCNKLIIGEETPVYKVGPMRNLSL